MQEKVVVLVLEEQLSQEALGKPLERQEVVQVGW
jgi:hypothetical protein